MRFRQLDRIVDLEIGARIKAERTLSAEEDYLADHFPRFPVMPGVLMLEAMFQASFWLVRKSEDFLHSAVLLSEARNVKYENFVEPGQTLKVTAEIVKQDATWTTLKAQGTVNGANAVRGRLVLERFNLAQRWPAQAALDGLLRRRMREEFERLFHPTDPPKTVV